MKASWERQTIIVVLWEKETSEVATLILTGRSSEVKEINQIQWKVSDSRPIQIELKPMTCDSQAPTNSANLLD